MRDNKRSIEGSFSHPRFRAAYDFLLLREEAGEDLGGPRRMVDEVPARRYKPDHPTHTALSPIRQIRNVVDADQSQRLKVREPAMTQGDFSKPAPRYIAVEGPIGVGKTTLTKRLADSFNYELLLEKSEENPFLDRFYQDPKQHALSTQLFFLFQRAQQIQDLRQNDMFEPVRVADFLIDKDQLFAQQNLEPDEYELYLNVYRHLTIDAPSPDLVYLPASAD